MTDLKNTEPFIPYDELTLGIQGNHRFTFRVQIVHFDGFNWVILDQSASVPMLLIQH